MSNTQSLSDDGQTAPLENTITDLIGLEVYTTDGLYIGEVDDVQVNFRQQQTTGLALTSLNNEAFRGVETGARGVVIPYRWVRAANDVILVMDILGRISPDEDF